MSIDTVVLILGFLIIAALVIFQTRKRSGPTIDSNFLELVKNLQQNLSENSLQMTKVLQENSKQLNDRLDKAAMVMRDVNLEVGKMTEIGRNMKELQEFLKSPKLRGNIGEQILKDLISQTFPKNSFHLQYAFKSGEKVDAIIQTDAGMLPIDAKFPMENFLKMSKAENTEEKELFQKEFGRDVKKHIDAIARKYILPDEGTMDFALMYVPSESVFYQLVNMDDIVEYAKRERVYVVSPSTLYAHLQTILLSFEGKKIEQKSREVFRLLRALRIDYTKVQESVTLLGKHLTNASNQYVSVDKSMTQLGQKLQNSEKFEDTDKPKLSS